MQQKDSTHIGPYRATRLWNEAIRTFRNGMPTSRHRRYMKSYEDCFSATEAIDWLHAQIQVNPNFGPSVTRTQTLQLLEKFQKARVFEDVRGTKHQEPIGENGRLYRFIQTSPAKISRTPIRSARTPLATRAYSVNTSEPATLLPAKLDFEKANEPSATEKPNLTEGHLVANNNKLSDGEAEDVWKALTLSNLQRLLQLHSLDDILDGDYVDAQNLIHNMTHVNKNGVVSNIKREDQLPHWVLTAMRCLAHWPNKVEDNLPDYPGFERDVYKVVKDYFEGLEEPLLTFSMYEVFTNVFVCAENAGKPRHQAPGVPASITTFASVENLMMDLTMNGMNSDEEEQGEEEEEVDLPKGSYFNRAYHPARSCDPRVNGVFPGLRRSQTARDLRWARTAKYASTRSLVPNVSEASSGRLTRHPSTLSMPLQADRLETSFGVDAGSPRTRVVSTSDDLEQGYHSFGGNLSTYKSSTCLSSQADSLYSSTVSKDPMYGMDETFFQNEHKCLSTNDVNRLVPYQENGLSRHSSYKTSYASIPEAKHNQQGCSDIYGYTVVLSTTPKSNHTRERHLSESNIQRHQLSLWNQPIPCDHDYSRQSQSMYHHPPPYIPPPDYKSIYQNSAPSVDSSRSSYVTAPSHPPTPDPHRHRYGSQSVDYVKQQQEIYRCKQEQEQRGKHQSNFPSRRRFESGSYRKAIDCDHKYSTPVGRSLFRSQTLRRCQSSPNLSAPQSKARLIECLRICCLLMPPPNRRKLHLLFRLMVKMAENQELVVDEDESTRELVLQTFTRCIIRSSEEADFDEVLSLRLVWFMMENYSEIMKVPEDLKNQIEERIAYLRRSKVSVEQFEKQRMSNSDMALNVLLDDIMKDKTMNPKEKKRRLKRFQKCHPEIYARLCPEPEIESSNGGQRHPKIKPALFSRPLAKLKSFRI